ncbi:MAG: type III-B CRISPR module RAMP protein Cmr1 [Desulfotomaculales bacterium]
MPDRVRETGLIGSLRWWYEALVRGLGGYACDPTGENHCPDKNGKHCAACELFGCTGWARKFRLEVLDGNGGTLRLRFIPLRPVQEEERALLVLTLHLIAEYGAIGGRTVFKPSDEKDRAGELHHRDFGLIQIVWSPGVRETREEIRKYLTQQNWRRVDHGDFAWASLQNFWCVKGKYLTRQAADRSTFNQVLGRQQNKAIKETKGKRVVRWSDLMEDNQDRVSRWLSGRQQESKKVFSFKADGGRTFGFVKPGLVDLDQMKDRLRSAWPDLQDDEFLTGDRILGILLPGGDGL